MRKARSAQIARLLSQTLSYLTILILLLAALLITEAPAPAKEPVKEGAIPVGEAGLKAAGVGEIVLPEPDTTGPLSLETLISKRRSVREYSDRPVLLSELSQLLWAAQGITGENGFKRAAPSAGAKYPIELFVLAGNVDGLRPGIYRYVPSTHTLVTVKREDARGTLCAEALSQECVEAAPLDIVITGVYERTMEKYGERGVRYVHIEVGAVAENIYLQAESLGLGTVFVGAFSDEGVRSLLGAKEEVAPLGIMPVGVKR
jgi:SagB-type dehydrogenase family enzyme